MSEPADPTKGGILESLADEDCRTILRTTHSPRTAPEISEACDIPLSTVYRKVDRLTELSLLETRLRIDAAGRHPTQYQRGIDGLLIQCGPEDALSVSVYRATEHDAGGKFSTTDGEEAPEDRDPTPRRDGPTPARVEFVGDDERAERPRGEDDRE
jgi:hypothetical protein